MNLRHHDNSFNNFLHNVRNLDNLFIRITDWYKSFFKAINSFKLGLYFIIHISLVNEPILLNNSVVGEIYFFDLFDYLLNSYYFLFNLSNFHYLLLNQRNLDNFVDESFHYFITSNENWLFRSNFNIFWHFNHLFNYLLDFINFRNFVNYLNNFILRNWHLFDALLNMMTDDWFFFDNWHFSQFLSNVRDYFLDLFNCLLNNNFLLNTRNFLNSGYLFNNFHNFLDCGWNLN